jgi:hypothetical protein
MVVTRLSLVRFRAGLAETLDLVDAWPARGLFRALLRGTASQNHRQQKPAKAAGPA